MAFRPAHRRKRDPFRRQILGVRKPPPATEPPCTCPDGAACPHTGCKKYEPKEQDQ